ncbi:MAG: TIGR03905 family TSCPD domain-containing protein, partial [Oscillospiraceae bacterium]
MTISFRPKGVCSQKMEIQVEDDKIVSLKILGGCHGNLQGISALVKGMDVDEV